MKGLAQILQGPVDARFDGLEFAAEKSGNFLILQFLKAAQKQDFSFFLRQLLERALQQFDFLLLLRRIRGKNRRQHFRRSEEHTSELQSHSDLVCRLLLEKKKKKKIEMMNQHTMKQRITSK